MRGLCAPPSAAGSYEILALPCPVTAVLGKSANPFFLRCHGSVSVVALRPFVATPDTATQRILLWSQETPDRCILSLDRGPAVEARLHSKSRRSSYIV